MLDNLQVSGEADRSITAMVSRDKVQNQRRKAMKESGHPHGQPPPMDKDRRDQSLAR